LHICKTQNYHFILFSLQAGQFQTIDTNSLAPTPLSMQPVNTHGNYITSFDISETCQVLAFGDSGGMALKFLHKKEKYCVIMTNVETMAALYFFTIL